MLKNIGLNNLRSFKNLKDLEIKPITILCGTNSSGKSTILKSLLLWKQTLENLSSNDGFLLNGRYTNLGTQENLLHNNTKNKVIKFSFLFEMSSEDLKVYYSMLQNEEKNEQNERCLFAELVHNTIPEKTLNSSNSIQIEFTIGYKINLKREVGEINEYNLKIIPIENDKTKKPPKGRLSDDIQEPNNVELKIKPKISKDTKGAIEVEWKNLLPIQKANIHTLASERFAEKIKNLEKGFFVLGYTGSGIVNFSNILELSFSASQIQHLIDIGKFPEGMAEVNLIMENLRKFLTGYFSGISYLGPLREEPSRRYIYDNPVNDIGIKGENSALLYHKNRESQVTYKTLDTIFDEHPIVGTLEETVREWLDEIGILGFDSVKSDDDDVFRFYVSSSEFNKEKVNIADVGFGVSQVIPIVIASLLDQSETLILEQPEIHLHPKMQMKLADFIISMAISGRNFIIETHSEHIINRLVRRIVEDEKGKLNSLIGINFIKNTEKGSKIEKVKINEKNGIENWPDEFFDQAAEEQHKILDSIIQNKMRNKK